MTSIFQNVYSAVNSVAGLLGPNFILKVPSSGHLKITDTGLEKKIS